MRKNKRVKSTGNNQQQTICSSSRKKKKRNLWKESRWKELCNEAVGHFKCGDYQKAVHHYNRALELNPYDKNALVARSKCHLLMGNAQLALTDAEQALMEDKYFIKGLFQKAEALYHLAQFEYSLMYFHKGLHIRPQMENFRQGVHKAQQAIINTIGKTVPCFEKFVPRKTDICSSEVLIDKCYSMSASKPKSSNVSRNNNKLLKELHSDKVYLEKLMRNPNIIYMNGSTKADNRIFVEAKEGKEFLENRQHFWKQQQALTPVKAAKSGRHLCKM